MRKCKCGWCRACYARYKMAQVTEPSRIRETHRGIARRERPKGRKARLDELLQARKNFFYYLDRVEENKGRAMEYQQKYGSRHRPWFLSDWDKEQLAHYRNRYLALLESCQKDKII